MSGQRVQILLVEDEEDHAESCAVLLNPDPGSSAWQ